MTGEPDPMTEGNDHNSAPVGLLLAAGQGRRFGQPKALVVYQGERLVDRAARLLRSGGCERVVVVSGAVALSVADCEVVHNARWRSGMGSSLAVGLRAVTGAHAAVIVPVDMPWLGPESVRRLAAADAPIAVATYGGRRGHPVLLGGAHFADVCATAVGDVGARVFLRAHPELVTEVPCDDTGRPDDVDYPENLVV